MIAILRRARRTTSTNLDFPTRWSALLLPLMLALSLLGSAAQAKVEVTEPAGDALRTPDEVAAILSAQPEGPAIAKPDPLGQFEEPEAAASFAPEAAITCNGAGGLWSAPGSWTGGFPTAADSVTIGSGCTITIDTAAVALSVVVQSGGLLEYDSALAQSLTVAQSVTIDSGGTFQTPASGTVTTHALSIGTNLTNNGTLDFSTNTDTAGAGITFTGAGNATFSGSGATTDLRTLTINKGTSFANTLELSPTNLTVQGTTTDGAPMAFLTLTNGTLKISGSFTMAARVFTSVGYTIPATGGFWLNNPNFTVSGQTGSPANNGLFRLSNGTFNVGTASGNSLGGGSGSFFTIEGGTLNVAGRLNSSSTLITYRQSGGIVNISTVGNAASTTPSFGFTGTGGVSYFSGGTINLVQASTGGTPVDYNHAGTMNFTGGTLNVGTAATATAFTFRVQGQMPHVVIDNTTNNKTANLSGQGNVWGNLTINAGTTLNLNPGTAQTLLMIGPGITNNGAIVVNTNNTATVNFAGSLQQVGVPYAQTYAGTGTFGTALFRIGSFSVQSSLGVTLDPAVSNLNIYRINAFYGAITNSDKLANGNADAVVLVIQRGATGIAFPAGSLDVAPTFSIGAGGLNLVYAQSTTLETTGPEIPATRTIQSFQIANPTGVTLAGGALTATGTATPNFGLVLAGGTLNTSAANLLTLSATTATAISGGSALTYVNGPLARTLPASLAAAATYTFPVGKGSFKMLELVNPTTNAGGTVVVQTEVFDANSGGTAGVGFSAINTDRYWSAAMTSGAANFTNATVRLTEQGTVGINAIGQSATQAGAYDSIGGVVAAPVIGPSSAVTALGYFAVGTLTGSTTICGNYNVFGTAIPPDFTTLTAAVTALNSRIMTCAVSFTLLDSLYPAETYPIIIQPNGGASATNTLTIKPGPGINPSFTGSAATALLILNGADWVTIDGANTVGGTTRNTTFANTNVSTSSAVIWGQSIGTNDPATNNTLKNLNVVGNASTTTLVGIGFGSSTIGTASVGSRNNNNRVQNNAITAAQFGVFSQGASSLIKNTGTVITGNTLGGAGALALGRVGIYVAFDDGAQVTNNTINGVISVASVDALGIALGAFGISNTAFSTNNDVANVVVTGNIIGTVSQTNTFSAAGISMGTNNYGTSLIANNSVWGVVGDGTAGDFCVGIYVGNNGTAYSTTLVYYNSVSMVGNRDAGVGGATSQPAFALAILGANPKVDLRNNALYNISTAGTGGPGGNAGSYAIGLSSTAPYTNLTSNYNDFFTSGTSSHFALAGSLVNVLFDQATLAAWQAALGTDANSIAVDPTFSSTINLQPSPGTPLVGAGTPVAVTVDILGIARSVTTPTIGAYEQAADVAGPVITYTAFGNTSSTANRTLAITATDFSGVPTAGIGLPVVYLRKGLAGAYSASPCVFVSGSAYNCTLDYTLIGGVVAGDTIEYFVAAQDNVGNVSANPAAGAAGFTANPPAAATPPTPPASYLIATALSGPLSVGTGGGYPSLTNPGGLFEAINNNVLNGNLTIDILSDLTAETGAVALNQWVEEGAGGYTLLIRPSTAPRVISGTSTSSSLVILNGADRVTIDGSTSGGTDRSLTLTNLNAAGVVVWIHSANASNGASNNTIKNCLISGNSGTTTIAGVLASGTVLGGDAEAPNSNNTIQNNVITKVQNGLYLRGGGVTFDQNWLVTGNTLGSAVLADKLSFRGMLIGNAQSFTVSGNTVLGVTSATTSTANGIQVAFAVSGGTISGNTISDIKQTNTGGWGSAGITLGASNTTAGVTVLNNMIRDVASFGFNGVGSADNGYGLVVASGGGYSIYANSIQLDTDQTAAAGITAAVNVLSAVIAPGAIDLRDNILASIQTVGTRYGVLSSAPAAVFSNINYNDYFAQNVGFLGVAQPTLGAWQTATGQDANSLAVGPLFVSATDLHLQGASPMRDAGTPLAAVTVDFDGDLRDAVTPEIGADEIRRVNLSITKDDSAATEVPGTSVTYTIVAANAGPYDALGVTVADTFPAALLGCSTTCVASPGSSCTAVAVLGNLNDTANLLIGGSVTYTAVCNVATDATGTLANTATVAAASNAFDPNNGDNSATDTDTLTPEADLAITKTDGVTIATAGGSVTYTIVASNAGPSAAPGSNVTDNFPAACTLVSWTCLGSGSGTCTAGGSGNINDSVNLPVGGSVTYTAVCSIDGSATGSLVNTTTVATAGGVTDPASGNNSATDTDTLAPQADLSITKTDGVTVASPGTNTTYTIVAANAGPSSAPTAAVIDIFPAACTSANWTCSGLGGGTCALSGSGNINQSVNLPSGGSVTFIAVCAISPTATGTLSNTATIGVGVNDPNTANNSATDVDTLSNEIFVDGFETGDTSQWSATVPPIFEVYATVGVAAGASEAGFGYDFAAVQSGEVLAPTAIAFVTDAAGKPLFLIAARRTDPNGQLELTLEIVGGGRSSWVPVGEVGQQVQLEWAAADQSNLGHVAVSLDGRLALWVEDYAGSATPAGVKLLRAPAPVAP